jgi:signal transduction histidine kinase
LAVVALPLAIGFAVLQRRLYDFDLVVHRTLLFTTLSASVVGVYLLAVAAAGSMIGIRNGWGLGLVGAGAVAAAAEPLRRALQRGANRLVYGEWEDPSEVGRRLGLRLADAAAPRAALDAALGELAGTLRLRWAAIDAETRLAEVGATGLVSAGPASVEIETPLIHHGDPVGFLRTVPGRRLRARDIALLQTLARQVAPVVHARQLAEELRQSRDRLAMAQMTERRRLRRDLHDGLGPTLAALAFKVDTARNVLAADPAAETLLLEIRDRLRDTVADVRRVVDGLRPPYLDELGLDGALRRLVADLPGPTTFRLHLPDEPTNIAGPLQVAVYRIVQEALTNVVRHAQAEVCDVIVATDGADMALTISDDGTGPTGPGAGHGLTTMRERVEELGGTFAIAARGGRGTVVTVAVPG